MSINTHIHLNIRSQARNMVNSLVEVNWIFMIRRGRIQNRWLSTCGKGKVMYLFIHNMYRKIVVWRLGGGKGGGAGVIYENIPSIFSPHVPFPLDSYHLYFTPLFFTELKEKRFFNRKTIAALNYKIQQMFFIPLPSMQLK